MITVTKKFKFCYGHYLPGYAGDCARLHGHNSTLEVEFGPTQIEEYEGMILDFKTIKKAIQPLVDELDHRLLNEVMAVTPTAENIIRFLLAELQQRNPDLAACIVRVRLYETDDSYAEWRKGACCGQH